MVLLLRIEDPEGLTPQAVVLNDFKNPLQPQCIVPNVGAWKIR
jgi:hypothetical protein